MAHNPMISIEEIRFVVEYDRDLDSVLLQELILCDESEVSEHEVKMDDVNVFIGNEGYYVGIIAAVVSDMIKHCGYFTLEQFNTALLKKMREDDEVISIINPKDSDYQEKLDAIRILVNNYCEDIPDEENNE